MTALHELPPVVPDSSSTERVRLRCHDALQRQERRRPTSGDGWLFAAAALYLATALHRALEFLR